MADLEMKPVLVPAGASMAFDAFTFEFTPRTLYFLPNGSLNEKPSFIISLGRTDHPNSIVGQFSEETLVECLRLLGYKLERTGEPDPSVITVQKTVSLNMTATLLEDLQEIGVLDSLTHLMMSVINGNPGAPHPIEFQFKGTKYQVLDGDMNVLQGVQDLPAVIKQPFAPGKEAHEDADGTWRIWYLERYALLPARALIAVIPIQAIYFFTFRGLVLARFPKRA